MVIYSSIMTEVRFRRGSLHYTSAGLALTRAGGGWQVGPARLRFVAVRRVRFVLWYLLGGLLTAYCLIGILGNSLNPWPAWGGLLGGALLLTIGLKGAWQLSAHLDDTADPLVVWLYGADEGALLRFEEAVNADLRAAAEARRLAALAAEEAQRAAAAEAADLAAWLGGPTSATGGATFRLEPPVFTGPWPVPPNPYPPSLLPGILP